MTRCVKELNRRRASRERQRVAREKRAFEVLKNKVIHLSPHGRKSKLTILQLAIQRIKDLLEQLGPNATIPQFITLLPESDQDKEEKVPLRKKRTYHRKTGKKVYVKNRKKNENPLSDYSSTFTSSSADYSLQSPVHEPSSGDNVQDDDDNIDNDYQPQNLQLYKKS